MSSGSSMGYLAPSGIDSEHRSKEPLPPQRLSWAQATVQAAQRFLWGSRPPMAPSQSDLQARYAKAKELHHGPGLAMNHSTWWKPWTEAGRHKAALALYKDVAPELLEAEQLNDAGEAFEAAALLQKNEFPKTDDDDALELLKLFENASQAYDEARPTDSARCQQEMVQFWMKNRNPRAAAPIQDRLGDLYAKRLGDTDKAIESWQKAGKWYKNARHISTAVGCYKKAGAACAEKGDYYKAIEIYEWCADNYPGEGITKQSQTVGFFFNAGLCHIATTDTVALSRALKKYCDMDYSFSSSREGRFLIDLSQALDAGDEHRYMDLCNHFDSMTLPPLPGWKKNMLVKGHLKIKGGEDDFS